MGASITPDLQTLKGRLERALGPAWRVDVARDVDHDGDPSVLVCLTLRKMAPPDAWLNDERRRIESTVRTVIAALGVDDGVYVRFLKETEEALAT